MTSLLGSSAWDHHSAQGELHRMSCCNFCSSLGLVLPYQHLYWRLHNRTHDKVQGALPSHSRTTGLHKGVPAGQKLNPYAQPAWMALCLLPYSDSVQHILSPSVWCGVMLMKRQNRIPPRSKGSVAIPKADSIKTSKRLQVVSKTSLPQNKVDLHFPQEVNKSCVIFLGPQTP